MHLYLSHLRYLTSILKIGSKTFITTTYTGKRLDEENRKNSTEYIQ